MERLTCKNCLEIKEASEFSKAGWVKGVQRYRSVCKKCHSQRVRNDELQKCIERRPDDFYQCNDCMKIFHKRYAKNGCRACGSTNIERGNECPQNI